MSRKNCPTTKNIRCPSNPKSHYMHKTAKIVNEFRHVHFHPQCTLTAKTVDRGASA